MQYFKNLNNQAKTEKLHKIFGLSHNVPFLVLTTAIGSLGLPLALDGLLPFYSAFLTIPGGLIGFFAPKIIHKICLASKGKIGKAYAKNKIGEYVDAVYKYYLLCLKKVTSATNLNEFSEQEFIDFSQQATITALSYKNMLDKYVAKKISDRVRADYKKIVSLLRNEAKNKQKIQDIIISNKKFITPWVDIYNQYGKNAKALMQFACRFDENLQMPADNNFYADPEILTKKVNRYMAENGLAPTAQTFQFNPTHQRRENLVRQGVHAMPTNSRDFTNEL